VTRRALFVVGFLFAATLCAMVVTQRAKDSAAVLRRVHVTPAFTPNGDGWRDRLAVRFMVGRADHVSVSVLDERGRVVRTLARDRRLRPRRFLRLYWDGRTTAGRPAPDGVYRVRVRLRRRARNVILPQETRLRVLAPHARAAVR
jgi:hypothetical protein